MIPMFSSNLYNFNQNLGLEHSLFLFYESVVKMAVLPLPLFNPFILLMKSTGEASRS